MSGDTITCEGVVIDCAHDVFRVEVVLGGGKRIALCKLSGRLHVRRIRVTPGDTVTCELSPYDPTRGRITFRGRKGEARP